MSSPVVSIVMPVYGVEKYLRNSIDSVLNQTFSDFELILVDDKSPDKSPIICDEYASKYDKIKVIHLEKNGGLSNARNEGLNIARGRYIMFLDSDDSFRQDMLEVTVKSITDNPAQVVVFSLREDYYNKEGVNYDSVDVFYDDKALKTKEDVRKEVIHLEDIGIYGYAWNKLYDLEYMRKIGIKFKTVTLVEDILFNIEFFNNIDACNILSDTLYYYRKNNSSSLTGKFIPTYYENIMRRIKAIYGQYENWNCLSDEVKGIIANRYSRYVFSALERNCDKRMGMSGRQRCDFFDREIGSELFGKLSAHINGKGLFGIMTGFFKSRNRFMCLCIARVIYIVKKYFPKLFEKIN